MPTYPQRRANGTGDPQAAGAARAGRDGPVVYYDGQCGLCGRLIALLLSSERCAHYRFAPLQGETARRVLGPRAAEMPTVVLERKGRRYTRSGAALRILAGLGGGWRAAALLLAVPRPLRDAAYDWVARRRRRWFGGSEACLPDGAGRDERFLA